MPRALLRAFAACLLGALQAPAQQTLALSLDGGRFTLEAEKTGLLSGKKHVFSFPAIDATLLYDPARPAASIVEFSLDAASIRLEDAWLTAKQFKEVAACAVSKQMLDVARYPRIRFKSTKIESVSAARFTVTGDLTIRDVTRAVTVDVLIGQGEPLRFDGSSRFPMTLFGLKPPKALLGLIGTKDELSVAFRLVAR